MISFITSSESVNDANVSVISYISGKLVIWAVMTNSLGSGQEKPNANMETCVGKERLVGQTVTDGNLLQDCE